MKPFYNLLLLTVLITACENDKKNTINTMNTTDNPLIAESTLPYHAPDFEKIKNSDFKPAFLKGISEQKEAVEKIANLDNDPTFDNTVLALEKSGILLERVSNVFYGLSGAHTNDSIKAIQEEIAPKLSELGDAIYLNDKLFE